MIYFIFLIGNVYSIWLAFPIVNFMPTNWTKLTFTLACFTKLCYLFFSLNQFGIVVGCHSTSEWFTFKEENKKSLKSTFYKVLLFYSHVCRWYTNIVFFCNSAAFVVSPCLPDCPKLIKLGFFNDDCCYLFYLLISNRFEIIESYFLKVIINGGWLKYTN